MAQVKSIRLDLIRTDGEAAGTQVRVMTNPDVVEQYEWELRLMKGVIKYPPIEVVEGRGIYFIADGHHRVLAYRAAGKQVIRAKILPLLDGSDALESAKRYALQRNMAHGLQPSKGDQRNKARIALLIPNMGRMADAKLEEIIHVSHQTIGRARASMVRERLIPHPLTGKYFDEYCPWDYAAQRAFKDAFGDDSNVDFFEVCDYLRKLKAFEPAGWRMASRHDDGADEFPQLNREDAYVIHSGLIPGKVVAFRPSYNPVVNGLPESYIDVTETPEETTSRTWHVTDELIAERAAGKAMERLMKLHPKIRASLEDVVRAAENPETGDDLTTVLNAQIGWMDRIRFMSTPSKPLEDSMYF